MFGSPVKKIVSWLTNIFSGDKKGYIKTPDGEYYKIENTKRVSKKDSDDLPEKVRDKLVDTNVTNTEPLKQDARYDTYDGKTANEIMDHAADNDYVFSDVMENPDLVDCDTPGEAVQAIAESNPGWAKMVDIAEAPGDSDADVGEAEAGEAETGSTSEAGSSSTGESADASADADVGGESSAPSGDMAGVGSGSIDTGTGNVSIDTGSSSANSGGGANAGGSGGSSGGTGGGGGANG